MKNAIGIIFLFLLTINYSCTNEEPVDAVVETSAELDEINVRFKAFLKKNESLFNNARTESGTINEIVNEFLNDEFSDGSGSGSSGGGTFTGSGGGSGSGSGSGSGQTIPTIIHRFYNGDSHFYTTNYAEGVQFGFTHEFILGKANQSYSSLNVVTRWYNKNNYDRVLSKGTVGPLNHPAIAEHTYFRWRPLWPTYTWEEDFDGYYLGHVISNPSTPPSRYGNWVFEGVMGGARSSGGVTIYSYYNDDRKDHVYTYNLNELGDGAHGYVYEGVAFYLNQ